MSGAAILLAAALLAGPVQAPAPSGPRGAPPPSGPRGAPAPSESQGAPAPGATRDASAADAIGGAPAPGGAGSAPADLPAPAGDRRAANEGRGGTRHALGLGWHGTTFFSQRGSQYTFHSESLGYMGSFSASGPFVHAFALLPVQARQDGRVYATGDYYRRRTGGDLLLGWQWRFAVRRGVEGEAGPGLHGTLIWLPARRGYRDFSAMPLGVGGGGQLRWRTGARAFSRPVTLGAYASAAMDLWDPLRANDLDHGFTFRLGVVAGVGAAR